MISIKGNALIGSNLAFFQNVRIEIDDEGIITDISKDQKLADYILPASFIIIPGFVNGHVHVGDAFLKDFSFGFTLDKAVGPNGVKNKKLSESSTIEKMESIENSLNLLIQNGYTTFVDFREEGIVGIKLLKNILEKHPIRGIILGRKTETDTYREVSDVCEGLGLRDVFELNEIEWEIISEIKNYNPSMLLGIHVSESEEVINESLKIFGESDLSLASNYGFLDFVVHANYANEKELRILKQNGINIICCPISSAYFGLKYPPLGDIQNNNILLGLGTDNILTSNPDPFRLMAFTLYESRRYNQRISPIDVLKAITVNMGKILGRKIGQIDVGYSGDLIALNLDSYNLKFSRDVYTAITMRADSSDICFQIYKGKVVKWKNLK